jgi:hypothetical protein
MSRLPINFIIMPLCAFYFISCGFIDLRQIGYSIEPDSNDFLLSDSHSPVIVRFDTEMEKYNAQKILQVSSDTGVMKGDFYWKENDLYFVPVPGWTAGIRYTASLTGTIQSIDGRDLRLQHFVSFYAINKNEPPLLNWHYPADGASINTNNVFPEFHFSRSMDRLTVESSLTIEGISNKTFEWSDNYKIVKVIADKPFSPWISYRWNMRDSAKSIDGVPLAKTYSGYFTTNLDQTLPRVTGVFPVLFSDGSWYPTGADIETGLAVGQGIAVVFNKPMGESVLRSLRFEPALTGKTEMLSERSVVYIFSREPEAGTTYTLIVSSETKDSEGLKTGTDYKINFIPDIPSLTVLSFLLGSEPVTENLFSNIILPVKPVSGTGELNFSIRFSLNFSLEEKLNAAQKITLDRFFPGTATPAALQFASWEFDDCIRMRWEGLSSGTAEIPHYYKLVIPGGRGGISSGTGIYMKENFVIFLEAVNEN